MGTKFDGQSHIKNIVANKRTEILDLVRRNMRESDDPNAQLAIAVDSLATSLAIVSAKVEVLEEFLLAKTGSKEPFFDVVVGAPDKEEKVVKNIFSKFSASKGSAKQYEFCVDSLTSKDFAGWAWKKNDPGHVCHLQFKYKDSIVVEIDADNMRADLLAAGKGTGRHGFSVNPGREVNAEKYSRGLDLYIDGFKVTRKPIKIAPLE